MKEATIQKTRSLWDVCENVTFAVSDLEKVEYLAVSALDLTSIPPSEQGTIGRGELMLRNKELNTVISILIDEIAELRKTLTETMQDAESVYNETNKDKAS